MGQELSNFSRLAMFDVESLKWQYDTLGSATLGRLLTLKQGTAGHQDNPQSADLYTILAANHATDKTLDAFWQEITTVPPWVDWQQIERGQEVFHRYVLANIVGFALQGFIGENVAAEGPAAVLARTGGLSGANLIRRMKETLLWLLEITESTESLRPGGKGFVLTAKVRLLHASVRRRIREKSLANPSYFDEDKYGVPINTYDSVLTLAFFCCNPLWIQLPRLGLSARSGEIEDFVALYRFVGYLLGVPDEFFSSTARAKATMQYMSASQKVASQSSKTIAHTFIDTLAGLGPYHISRDLICAGCRSLNPADTCDDLGIAHPVWWSYIAFAGFKSLVVVMALVQRLSSRLDRLVVQVSFSTGNVKVRMLTCIKHSRKRLRSMITRTASACDGSDLEFSIMSPLHEKRKDMQKATDRRSGNMRKWHVEILLMTFFIGSLCVPVGTGGAILWRLLVI